jgi:hypothetical protein
MVQNALIIYTHPVFIQIYRWVHMCNVTVYHNTIMLQLTDTKQSYDLNFHSVPHGVTVPCERYTLGFPSLLWEPEAS